MPGEKLIMAAGPAMIPPRVLNVMGRQIIYHGTGEFRSVLEGLESDLQYVFRTRNRVLVFTASGTGAMESAVVNLFSRGDKVLAVSNGTFGERFAEIAGIFGLNVRKLTFNWGEAADIHVIKDIIEKDEDVQIKAVLMVHNETSTGVTNDIEAVGKLLKGTGRLLVVDAVSSAGGLELRTDEWGADVVVASSQKALMAPPGLGFVTVSDRAWKAYESSTLPKFYWDFKKCGKFILNEATGSVPFTPSISLLAAQAEALKMIKEEGLENVHERHKKLALATRSGIKALGLSLFPREEAASYTVTVVKSPEGIDIEKVQRIMDEKFDIIVTCGQRRLKGKILRIGHLGYVDGSHIIKTFEALEHALSEAGFAVEIGASVAAVRNALAGARL